MLVNLYQVSMDQLKESKRDFENSLRFDYTLSWFRKRKLKRMLKQVQDEIDYREGRKQIANRPYSKPSMVKTDYKPVSRKQVQETQESFKIGPNQAFPIAKARKNYTDIKSILTKKQYRIRKINQAISLTSCSHCRIVRILFEEPFIIDEMKELAELYEKEGYQISFRDEFLETEVTVIW